MNEKSSLTHFEEEVGGTLQHQERQQEDVQGVPRCAEIVIERSEVIRKSVEKLMNSAVGEQEMKKMLSKLQTLSCSNSAIAMLLMLDNNPSSLTAQTVNLQNALKESLQLLQYRMQKRNIKTQIRIERELNTAIVSHAALVRMAMAYSILITIKGGVCKSGGTGDQKQPKYFGENCQ